MKNYRNVMLVAIGAVALSGCATVMNGPNQKFEINSEPQGANVKLSTGPSCVTPCKIELPRRHDFRADFVREGYRPAYVLVQSKMGGATFGNILAGGIIGAVVDSSNGSANTLRPNPLNVRLVAQGQSGQEMLLDKKGKDAIALQAHNDAVKYDVAKSIGAEAAGLPVETVAPAAAPAPAPEPVPAPTPSPAPTGT